MKRLIVCCDGTWQKLSSPYPTNVVKMAQAVKATAANGIPQIVYYHEGLGTGDSFDKVTGGAFGWGIDQAIQNAYRFLCLNYEPGDEIYLFGFSRGAYTVRSLAGLIHCSGLLSRQNIRRAPEAYEIYRDRHLNDKAAATRDINDGIRREAPITLLGCWDTVGQLGVPSQIPLLPVDEWLNQRYQFHDCTLSHIIQNALHAVAIDEQRKVFNVTPMQRNKRNPQQVLRQVWFPGDHGCVGGGRETTRGLSDGALLWMIEQIKDLELGLELDLAAVEQGVQPNFSIPFDNSLKGIFTLTGQILREVVSDEGQPLFHNSVVQRWQGGLPPYRPENLIPFEALLVSHQFVDTLRQ
jgi:uncharacterized protein (DUF2235 family)